MTTALAAPEVPHVTKEELELIKKTIAQGATNDELKLYLYDCARQGVHPLDKLIHFTKRKGKYVPITSIDFMRIRAAETGEYAGSDDAVFTTKFEGNDTRVDTATVTVWRLVQGQRGSFTATARWSEYKPDEDFMWKKMPHTMLAKCAEALALRKGFPKQLAGLYAKEEMDQASNGAAAPTVVAEPLPDVPTPKNLPEGAVLLVRVEQGATARGRAVWTLIDHKGEAYKEWDQRRATIAEQYAQEKTPVIVETKKTDWGTDVKAIRKALIVSEPVIQLRNEPPLSEYDDDPAL